ncbi:hypothetical protein BuS5_03905 [Desulfosarcina sp. BuS5]|nr:hypothetical protein BuS5_03905 [Desulfosarcina sp. BuS5]
MTDTTLFEFVFHARLPKGHCVSPIIPAKKTLYPASPSLQWVAWASLPHLSDQDSSILNHRYYDLLRLPNVYLRFVRSSLSSPDTLYRPSFNVCVSANGRLVARRDIPMQRRDFACAGFPVTVLFTQGNIRVSQVPELPL